MDATFDNAAYEADVTLHPVVRIDMEFVPAPEGIRNIVYLTCDIEGVPMSYPFALTERQCREMADALVYTADMMRDGRAAARLAGVEGSC